MKYSPQKWFCNNCGKEMFSSPCGAFRGGHTNSYSLCSMKCSREIQWKNILSNFGKEYYPQPEDKNEKV